MGSANNAPRANPPRGAVESFSISKFLNDSFIRETSPFCSKVILLPNSLLRKFGSTQDNSKAPHEVPDCRAEPETRGLKNDALLAFHAAFDLLKYAENGAAQQSNVIYVQPLEGQVRTYLKKGRQKWLGFGVALIAVQIARPAVAQDAEAITPIELFEPESGDGLAVGERLRLYPRIEIDGTYDSNIYNIDQNEIDDLFVSIRPRFGLLSNFGRHGLEVFGGAEFRQYFDVTDENSEQYDIGARSLLELADRTELIVDGRFVHGIEQRGTAGDQFFTDSPVEFDRYEAGALLRRYGGFLEMEAEARVSEVDYNSASLNDVTIDLSERDATVVRARVRGSAPSTDHTRIFIQGSVNQVTYEQQAPVSRDSNGFGVLAGMHLRLTDLVDLEAGVGYLYQDFDDPAVDDVNGLNFSMKVDWSPQPDIDVRMAAGRTVEPSPLDTVPALVRSDFNLSARKVFGDRMLVTAEAGLAREKYEGINRTDTRIYVGLRGHYRVTDNIGLIGRVGYRDQDGGDNGRDYNGVDATIGVRIRL